MTAPQSLLSRNPRGGPACDEADSDLGSGEEFAADDLAALRLVKVPDWPPFDGDPGAVDTSALAAGKSGHGLACLNTGAGGSAHAREKAIRGGTDRLDASTEWARQFARLLTEALAGARPVRQILPWTSQRARVDIRRLMPLFDGGQRPRVLRVIATRPRREVIEMTVIVAVGARTRALAVRLEQAGPARPAAPLAQGVRPPTPPTPPTVSSGCTSGWMCTAVEAA